MKTARDKSSELFSTPEIGAAKNDRTEDLPNAKLCVPAILLIWKNTKWNVTLSLLHPNILSSQLHKPYRKLVLYVVSNLAET